MNSVINECVGGKSWQDWHTHTHTAKMYVQTDTHSEWGGALIYTQNSWLKWNIPHLLQIPYFFLPTCQHPHSAWLSEIAGISTHRSGPIARVSSSCVCVFTCRCKQARIMLGWSVCGKRSTIRPIWFVLQSQIKQEWWGKDSRALWRHGTAVAAHIYTATVASVSGAKSFLKNSFINNKWEENKVRLLYTLLLSAGLDYIRSPMDRAPSGERVMTNIEGTLGLDESACVCSHECASDAQSESHGLNWRM